MAGELQGKKIAFVMSNEGVEQVELTSPMQAVKDAGGECVIVSPQAGFVQAFNHLDKGDKFPVDQTTAQLNADEFDGVMLPGGVANPDQLRTDESAVKFVHSFFTTGKPIAAICHAPWTLVEAGVVNGRTLTSWPSLQTDIRNAGGTWVDQEVVVDKGLVTSRNPGDLDAFCTKMVEEFAEGSHADRQ